MKFKILISAFSLLMACTGKSQNNQLKSASHGFDMMLLDIPKKQLIDEMRFEHGQDTVVNVVRFDHVGLNLYPLIVSSSLPVATDSLGILSFKLPKDTLNRFLEMLDNVTPKVYRRDIDYVLIRVTYRFQGRLEQYYVTNARIVTGFLKLVEERLILNGDSDSLDKFYKFIARMKLQKNVNGKRTWIYYP